MMEQIIERTPAADRDTPMNVLIVEDDPDSRVALELAVRRLGHACVVACDGEEAWHLHRAARADVILSDWRMPHLDGVGLCARVRQHEPSGPHTYFVLVTARSRSAELAAGMRVGPDDYIAKPIDLEELEARLDVAFRAVRLQREGAKGGAAR